MAVASVTGGFTEFGNTTSSPTAGDYLRGNSDIFSSIAYDANNDWVVCVSPTNVTANATMGAVLNVTSIDLSTARRLVYGQVSCPKCISTNANSGGNLIALYSNSYANEAVWKVMSGAGVNTISNTSWQTFVVNTNYQTNCVFKDAGFDNTVVDRVGTGIRIQSSGYKFWYYYVAQLGYLDPYVIINGTAGTPGNFADISAKMATQNVTPIISPTVSIHYCKTTWIVGNGSTQTYFTDSIRTWEFVHDIVTTETDTTQSNVNGNSVGFEINASSTDVINLSISTFVGTTKYFWNIIGSSSATISLDTLLIKGAGTIGIIDGPTFESVTFDGCDRLVTTAPTMNNGVIKNSTDTHAIEITDTANLTNMRISGNATAMLFDFDGSASVSLDNIVFSDNTVDVEYTGSGVLTLNLSNGSVVTTTSATGTGSIVVAGEVIQQGLSFSGLIAGSQVMIYETGTTTLIDSVASSGTTFEWAETYVADQTVDYTIQKAGYIPIRVTGLDLSNAVVPVLIQQVVDRTYAASSGLTYATNVVINTGAKTIAVSANTTVQNLYNALIEFWKAETALRNIKFPVITNGPNSFTFIDGWELTSGSFTYLSRDGVRYTAITTGTTTATWCAVLSVGDVAGLTAEYQQAVGAAPTNAKASGVVDQLIQVYGDATHGNFDYTGYLDIKYQTNGYDEAVTSVYDQYGTLEDQLYVVAIEPTLVSGLTVGDPSITGVSITNHGASPVTWNGKEFSITITDTNTNTGLAIHRWLNYNKSLDATFQGFEPFNLFDMVVYTGSTYETRYGEIINSAGALLKGVRVVDGSGNPHPYFTRFQADDGTYYTPPENILLSADNLTAGRVQLYNTTGATSSAWQAATAYSIGDYVLATTGKGTALGDGVFFTCTIAGTSHATTEPIWDIAADGNTTTDGTVTWTVRPVEIDNATNTTGYNNSWVDGEQFKAGDTVRLRWTGVGSLSIDATAIAPASGTVAFLNAPEEDTVYTAYGVDGSAVTGVEADYVDTEVDITVASNFNMADIYAWWCYNLTLEAGIRNFYGGITGVDVANIRINDSVVDIHFDNDTATNLRQLDNIRIYRDDETYPCKVATTGGGGLDVTWKGPVYGFASSSGITTQDKNDIIDGVQSDTVALIGTPANGTVSADIASIKEDTDLILPLS